jgi:hypothetical protein
MSQNWSSNSLRLSTLLSALLAFPLPGGASEQDAVAALNSELAGFVQYGSTDDAYFGLDTTSTGLGVRGSVNLPVWRFIGASVSAEAAIARNETDVPSSLFDPAFSFSCTQDQWATSGTAFVRDPTIGRIRGHYEVARIPLCGYSSSSGEIENGVTNTTYGADVEYYFSRWTVAARFDRASTREAGQRCCGDNQYGGQVAFYPTTAWRISGGYATTPGSSGIETYTVAAEYQPAWLGNQLGIGLTYRRLSADWLTANFVRATITYYFGDLPDLLTRDRHFR